MHTPAFSHSGLHRLDTTLPAENERSLCPPAYQQQRFFLGLFIMILRHQTPHFCLQLAACLSQGGYELPRGFSYVTHDSLTPLSRLVLQYIHR